MERKKANMKIEKTLFRSVLFLIMLLHAVTASWGAITNQSVVLSSDLNGDGIAGIGDTITFTCRSTTVDESQYPYVNLSQFGNPYFALPKIAGNFYSAFLTISPGSLENNTVQTFQFADEDGVRIGGSLLVDNRRPNSLYGPSSTGATGFGSVFKVGDSLQLDMEMSTSFDSDVPRANLTNIGLGAGHMFSRIGGPDSAPVYRLSIPFPMNREGTATPITVIAADDAGNSRSWDLSVSYDTKEPEIQSVTAVNMTTGKTWVVSGDTIRIQAVISNYDFDKVKMYHPTLFPSGITMIKFSGNTPGTEAVYQYDYYLADVPDIQSNFVTFEVRAIDDAGNESSPRTSNPLALDNIPPEFSLPFGVSIIENGGVLGDNIAIINDQLHFFGNLSSIMNDVIVTIDLSAIGGVPNQIIPFNNTATTTFELLYNVGQYTSENSMPRAFTVTAKDKAGNTISQIILPIIYVDNKPPILTGGQIQNVSRPGQVVRHGDQIAISSNIMDLDNGKCWVNFERIGGSNESILTPYSGTTYRLDQLVGDPTFGNIYDQSVSFTIYAADDSGNLVQVVTPNIQIDNEPPLIIGSAFTSTPAISPTHPYVRVGDRITFRVQLASSAANIHDGETVSINLTQFGEIALTPMVYDGVGSYTVSVDVPAGTLNEEYYFPYTATDNAGNSRSATVRVKIDNSPPVVGPMAINFLADMSKAGVVNIGDRLEMIVPVNEPDNGTCTIDLSYIGGPSAYIMNYDAVLRRYYLVHDCIDAAMENPSYVFRAVVSDKAGNIMNSVSSTFEVDCRPPVIEYASATHIDLKGKAGVVNIGDQIRITAKVDLGRLDGGVPTVNLTPVGGNGVQQLFDDGANNDGIAGDGIYGYTHTVTTGTTDGQTIAFTVQLTDNAGNRAIKSTESLFVDNKPLVITSITNTQVYDNNGNGIVDLDGAYTTAPIIATDVVRLEVWITGNPGDMGSLTVDLTKMGINNTAVQVSFTAISGGWKASAEYTPLAGTTNREEVKLSTVLTDVNGNEVLMTCTNGFILDNRPPKIDMYPISFVLDNGRLNEANLGDVIRIKVRLTNHNDLLPQIEWTNLYQANGLSAPSPTLMLPSAAISNEYVYEWTIPEGLGTIASLTILAYDESGNMAYAYTPEIRFLSKTPVFAGFPQSRADLIVDRNLNNIINPTSSIVTGDEVKITCVMDSLYNVTNSPAAEVLVDIRSITNSTSDDFIARYNDGDSRTFWTALTYVPNSGSPYVYTGTFVASASDFGLDASTVSFPVKVLHPDTPSLALATSLVTCDPNNPFGIDTQVPWIKPGTPKMTIIETNADNPNSNTANIGDIITIQAEIERFSDPGSATVVLYTPIGNHEVFRAPMLQVTGSTMWQATFVLGTGTKTIAEELADGEWRIVNGEKPKFRIYVSDDADNMVITPVIDSSPQITFDNFPPQINIIAGLNRIGIIDNNGDGSPVANVVNGIASDSISVWVELNEAITNGSAYVDLSMLGATSTYMLQPNGVNATRFSTNGTIAFPAKYAHFRLDNGNYDLATYTFNICVVDAAGNKAYVADEFNQLAVDSKRPELSYATYNGSVLSMVFSEPINPTTFNVDYVRIGYKSDHTSTQIGLKTAVELSLARNDFLLTDQVSDTMEILLASASRDIVADWGRRTLYLSLATNDLQSAFDPTNFVCMDEAGNWLKPISRNITLTTILIPTDFYTRPKLIGGKYVANLTDTAREQLFITFDKDMDPTSLTAASLKNLAIWYNRASNNETWVNSYRFNTLAVDSYDPTSQGGRELMIELSQQAQDWIALKYGRLATQFNLQINGTDYEPPPYPTSNPPLIRDTEGNSVMPIIPANAVAATLIPLNTPFQISSAISLDLSASDPILSITTQNRRARLFDDTYSESSLTLTKTIPVDLSRIYIYEKANTATGRSISLGAPNSAIPMVKWTGAGNFTTLNDYASTTVRIPLTAEALKIMLSWGTSEFYMACSPNALKDLWGNYSESFPGTSGTAAVLTQIPPTAGYPPAKVHSVAMSPVIKDSALFKGQPAGSFFYEIAFETASLSADVRVPIARNIQPTLELFSQGTNTKLDTGTFVTWLDHNQGGTIRTVARFTNTGLAESGILQKEPVYVKVSGFTDIFNINTPQTQDASFSYDLIAKKDGSAYPSGFAQTASYPMIFDNKAPVASAVAPIGTIGITPAGSGNFDVTFSEDMNRTIGSIWQPQLRLGINTTTAMSFTFKQWMDSTTARFTNASNFDSSTPQGEYKYYVSGGFDEAGNRGANEEEVVGYLLNIRSKGPVIDSYKITTYQVTTAKISEAAGGTLTNAPFSPYVAPGIATITVTFSKAPRTTAAESIYLHFFTPGSGSLGSAPIDIAVNATEGKATWNGTFNGVPVGQSGPITYELRVYDDANNEGSARGSLTYDGAAPIISSWKFANVRTFNNTAYFNPSISSFVKIDAAVTQSGQSLKMRLTRPPTPPADLGATDTYPLTALTGGNYTISFDGRTSDATPGSLSNGSYTVSVVDQAGNEGIPQGASSQPTAKLIIDTINPEISALEMYRVGFGAAVTSFNPNAPGKLRFEASSTDPSVASGTALIVIKAGSTLIRELMLEGSAPTFTALWDGKDSNQQLVKDGIYTITIIDLAGNPALGISKDLKVTTSVFKVTGAVQKGLDGLLVTFNQSLGSAVPPAALFTLNPTDLALTPLSVDDNKINLKMSPDFGNTFANLHGRDFTLTITPGYASLDGEALATGNNLATFTTDFKGPALLEPVTFEGLNSQKKFNLIFDEVVTLPTAQEIVRYTLRSSTATDPIQIESVVRRADQKSVTVTTFVDIVESMNYTITAAGVEDSFGNKSDGTLAISFQGQDITPPDLTISAFSNPANEFDISIVVKSNENLSGAPTATITQSGGTAVSLILNAGPNSKLFIGGAHLDPNYPGVATIKVTGKDMAKNTGTANMSFSTAYINASIRAEIRSPDNMFAATFEPGTLNKNSLVSLLPEALVKVDNVAANAARILPSTIADADTEQLGSLRASVISVSNNSAEELMPMGQAYTLNVPPSRIQNPVRMSLKLSPEQIGSGIGLYRSDANGWKPVEYQFSENTATFAATTAGTFAMMKDIKAPRATMLTKISAEPIREARPAFRWKLEEYASGIDYDSAWVVLNGKMQPLMIDTETATARFIPVDELMGGEHEIGLKISDRAGNQTITQALRFVAAPPLKIQEVVQFPNPARNRVNLRVSTNRPEVDWGEIEVNIYDVAGHKVADQNSLTMRAGTNGLLKVQDIIWDLRATGGKAVANGVYFAKITVRDPDDWNKKTRYNHKIAVLR